MDRSTIIAVAICVLCFFGLQWMVKRMFPPIQVPVAQYAATNSTTSTNSAYSTNAASSAAPGAAVLSAGGTAPSRALIDTNAPEQLLVVSNAVAHYTFTSRGGGLKTIDLIRYPETVSSVRKKKGTGSQEVATLNEMMPLPVGALLGDTTLGGDGNFELQGTTNGVVARKTLETGLVVQKTFTISTNYLVDETVRLENHAEKELAVPDHGLVVGSATPIGPKGPRDYGQFVGVMWYDGTKADQTANQGWFANKGFLSCVTHSEPRSEYHGGASNVVWVAAHNQFFTFLGMPASPARGLDVYAVSLPRDAYLAPNAPSPQGFQASISYAGRKLAAGQAIEEKMTLFAGPKEYRTLAEVGEQMKNNADLVMGYSGFLGGFARGLLLTMNWLHDVFRLPYGWAIIAITVILKMVFWPLTASGARSMKRMSALQPQMKAIQEKYKDDPAKMNRKTMEFMKEHKINPVGGCLPMLIQMPILFGFYRMIQSAIELRGAPFLWIGDLTQPDTLFVIPGLTFVPFLSVPGVGLPINLLPIIMVGSQIWQAHLTPPSPGMDPGQQKMMRYMPLMFLLFMYNLSAGLTLYWTVSNLLSILQTKMTKTGPSEPVPVVPIKKARAG